MKSKNIVVKPKVLMLEQIVSAARWTCFLPLLVAYSVHQAMSLRHNHDGPNNKSKRLVDADKIKESESEICNFVKKAGH